MKITNEQREKLYELRLVAISRKLEAERLHAEYLAAQKREKTVHQAAIDAGQFTYDLEPRGLSEWNKGQRITDGSDAYLMNESVFANEFLPLVQLKWKELYSLEYPVNYTPTYSEYAKPYHKALKRYREVAVDFLRICGETEAAEDFEKALNSYLPEKYAKRIDELNEMFIAGR